MYLIDVRSESEFKKGSIEGAVNIPILNDEERGIVGYTYLNKSIMEAKQLGMKFVSYKLENIFNVVSKEFSNNRNIVFLCARGGMRSGTIHNLFSSMGIKNRKLNKGYKGYRKFLIEVLPKLFLNIELIVIHGKTGVGKTCVLKKLHEEGYPVIDLEGAANHRASFLGAINLGDQNSQQQFESIILNQLMGIIKSDKFNKIYNEGKLKVFIEGESKRIGKIIIPEYIFSRMIEGKHILIDGNLDFRVKNLIKEYLKIDENNNIKVDTNILFEFEDSLKKLEKYSSKSSIEEYFALLKGSKYRELAEKLIREYYDPKYGNAMKKHDFYHKVDIHSIDEFVCSMKKIYEKILE